MSGQMRGTLRLVRSRGKGNETEEVVAGARARRARAWANDLDVTIAARLTSGDDVHVSLPVHPPRVGRPYADTVENYRRLRLGVGDLVRPWLLDHEELVPPPLATLYPFQRRGVAWLLGKPSGAILADDMGLGKTIQAIAALRLLFNRAKLRHALVLCPKSLITNWEAEFQQWAPELGVVALCPPAGVREAAWRILAHRRHVILTNYEQMREPPEILRNAPPDLMIADEAHRLRKRTSKLAAGVRQLSPKRFWALSGTPLERNTDDLATLLSLVAPARFSARDARLHPSSLRAQARPYVLRRRKREVLDQLPPVQDTTERLNLAPQQQRAYRRTIRDLRRAVGHGNELALLTRLRQICDVDPESGASSKVDRIVELLLRVHGQTEKGVVFAYLLEPLRNIENRLARRLGAGASRLLIGDMDIEQRARAVRDFREDESVAVLLASTRVGGEGLTLVEASHVFLLDQWWNPSSNNQAIDRVVRIGQQKPVRIYRFCCRHTIEERLETILHAKRALFESTVERLAETPEQGMDRIRRAVGVKSLIADAL